MGTEADQEIKDQIAGVIRGAYRLLVDQAYEQHRLAFVHNDEDSEKPAQLFVCKCKEAFDRRGYNAHIRDAYKGG